jgi:hypothetical protein
MTKTFVASHFMAPVCRTVAFSACLGVAALAPALSERLESLGGIKIASEHRLSAASAETRPGESAKILDRINASWPLTGDEIAPLMAPENVRQKRKPVEAFQIAGHLSNSD